MLDLGHVWLRAAMVPVAQMDDKQAVPGSYHHQRLQGIHCCQHRYWLARLLTTMIQLMAQTLQASSLIILLPLPGTMYLTRSTQKPLSSSCQASPGCMNPLPLTCLIRSASTSVILQLAPKLTGWSSCTCSIGPSQSSAGSVCVVMPAHAATPPMLICGTSTDRKQLQTSFQSQPNQISRQSSLPGMNGLSSRKQKTCWTATRYNCALVP